MALTARRAQPGPAAPQHPEHRLGVVAGASAYTLWGLFPLVFHQLEDVAALEILLHRVVWSFVVVAALLVLQRDRRWFEAPLPCPRAGACRPRQWVPSPQGRGHGFRRRNP